MEAFGWMCAGVIVFGVVMFVVTHVVDRMFPIQSRNQFQASPDALTHAATIASQSMDQEVSKAAKEYLVHQWSREERRKATFRDAVASAIESVEDGCEFIKNSPETQAQLNKIIDGKSNEGAVWQLSEAVNEISYRPTV